jgi:hypothetical protein
MYFDDIANYDVCWGFVGLVKLKGLPSADE